MTPDERALVQRRIDALLAETDAEIRQLTKDRDEARADLATLRKSLNSGRETP